ncbi:MAG TPA: acyl-CoA reductase [Saprospiraceae bacterium]|nr:acyl-CoA reductase [Saprospiraceae bacterium]
MKLEERISALIALGKHLQEPDEYREAVMHRTHFNNQWFTKENQRKAIQAIATHFLSEKELRNWLAEYDMPENPQAKTVGLVMAGNIPLVGFHDVFCTFLAGHRAMIKLSEKDKFLLPYFFRQLAIIDPRTADYFVPVERLQDFDAVVATGSNNSARYFEQYFGKYPHIIRKNRNAIAVLDGTESKEELEALGTDVFQYFGLGCRNVAKLYVPRGYSFEPLLEALHEHREIVLNDKYKNNFDYNYAILVLNKEKYMANGCIILKEDRAISSPIAGLNYAYYQDLKALEKELKERKEEIQLVVAKDGLLSQKTYPFGKAQQPELSDYADGVDTIDFLLKL